MIKITKITYWILILLILITVSQVRVFSQTPSSWTKTITLREYMKRYVFPEELISYEVDFPGTFPADRLKLTEDGKLKEYQLENVETGQQGNLVKAQVHFRTGLDKGQTREFVLQEDPDYTAGFSDRVVLDSVDN